jgi:hypothetical protein
VLPVDIALACVEINRDKAAPGEGVETDMALGDHDESTDAAGILAVHRPHFHDCRFADGMHADGARQLQQDASQVGLVGKQAQGCAISVDHDVDAELFCCGGHAASFPNERLRVTGRSRS